MYGKDFGMDGLPSADDVFRKMGFSSKEMAKAAHDEALSRLNSIKLSPEEAEKAPDTYACEMLFLDGFINDDMLDDFELIARDFLQHEFANMDRYENVEYLDYDNGNDSPEWMFKRYILNLMMNAANGGSEYARCLFLYLYKTYYKKEYKTLKRFNRISAEEVLSVATYESEHSPAYNMARVLTISKMSGIKLDPSCNLLYRFLSDYEKHFDKPPRFEYSDYVSQDWDACKKEIEDNYDEKKLYSLEEKARKYLGNVLRWCGYDPEYVDMCDENGTVLPNRLATVLAILKKTYPNRKFTGEELILYYMIYQASSAMTSNSDWFGDELRTVAYGERATDFYVEFPQQFHPEDVMKASLNVVTDKVANKSGKNSGVPGTDNGSRTGIQQDTEPVYKEEKLLAEIDELHRKLHSLENENKSLREEISGKRKLEEDYKKLQESVDSNSRELTNLRSYVYNLTGDEITDDGISYDDMKKDISQLRIIIVGGHTKWVAKIKQEFPDWKFVSATVSGTLDTSIVDKADHVFFFSDTISHSTYYKYLNVLRERKISFGYIHGVNIENNIRHIYNEMKE